MTNKLLLALIVAVLIALPAGLALQGAPALVWRHVILAAGIMPLILGAMLYFVPVLTRSASANRALFLPLAALMLGVLVVVDLQSGMARIPLLAAAAALVVAAVMAWTWRRRRGVFGTPHPGIDWYLYALAALLLALLLIVSRAFWPEYSGLARVMHLHLNLIGFLGLTAVGTLRVLLPTVLGGRDPGALRFLRRQLPFALFGTLAIAVGAAWSPPLALLGALAWLSPAAGLVLALRNHESGWQLPAGAGVALAAAALGWLAVLLAGAAHGLGAVSADKLLYLLLFLFLLPLVTGATSYLLPVWRWPGAATAAQQAMRGQLTAGSGLRVAGFWLSALLVTFDVGFAAVPAIIVLVAYSAQVLFAFVRVGASREHG